MASIYTSRGKSKARIGYGLLSPTIDTNPFGASMADDIFGTYDYDNEPVECVSDDLYTNKSEGIEDEEYWYQTELPLESLRELEDRMRYQIARFERCYKKMMVSALQWHYLQEEIADNAQVEKMFNDMQMIRKLTGSEVV